MKKDALEIMGIKTNISIISSMILLWTSMSFGQIELQRKYKLNDLDNLKKHLTTDQKIGEFSTKHYAIADYYDLYIDSPDLVLLQHGFSLRFRKKIINKDTIYLFQLKNEMTSHDGIRIEVEESELDFYMIQYEQQWVSLQHFIDLIFNEFEKAGSQSKVLKNLCHHLTSWLTFKSNAPLMPFQELKFRLKQDNEKLFLKHLKPVLIGKSLRVRNYIYMIQDTDNDNFYWLNEPINKSKLPYFFRIHPTYIWLAELSLDQSFFFSLLDANKTKADIIELELEGKRLNVSQSILLMSQIEDQLKLIVDLMPQKNSKYKQIMTKLGH